MKNEIEALPKSFLVEKKDLPEHVLVEVKKLSGSKPIAFLLQIFYAWSFIITTILIALNLNNLLVTIVSIFLIATRMNVLGLLLHEQSHLLGIKNKLGNMITNFFCAYPLGVTVDDYKSVHLMHHKYYFTEKDPDCFRKSGRNWVFPQKLNNLLMLFLRDIIGLSFVDLVKGKYGNKSKNLKSLNSKLSKIQRITFYSLFIITLFYFEVSQHFLVYWIVPLVFALPVIVRIGAICEHIYSPRKEISIYETTPIINSTLIEKIFLPDLNFKLHIYHHLFPNVSFSNLDKIHQLCIKEKIVNEEYVFKSTSEYFKFLLGYRKEKSYSKESSEYEAQSKRYFSTIHLSQK